MLTRLSILTACALAIGCMPALAQNNNESVRDVIEEKLKLPLERLQEYLASGKGQAQGATAGEKKTSFLAPAEFVVSDDALPESEVHAAINPTDPMNIVVSPIRLNPNNMQEALICPVYSTKDFGVTWQKSAFKTWPARANSLVAGGGDPVFAFDANGKLYFSWIDLYVVNGAPPYYMAIFWASSTDGGVTFTMAPNPLIGESSFSSPMTAREAFDKQWLAVDRTNSQWRNTLYAVFYHPEATGQKVEVRRKDPDSAAFTQQSVRLSTAEFKFTQFCSITVDPSGGVHATFFGSKDSITYGVYHCLSTDGARSFGAPTLVSNVNMPRYSANDRTGTVPGIQNNRVYPCPHIVADHSGKVTNGFLYATWAGNGVDAKLSNGLDVYFSRSTDNGASWSAAAIVNDDTRGVVRDQFHPSLYVNAQGLLSVIWYDRREDAANASAKLYYTQSADAGLNFARNRAVAPMPMNISLSGKTNGGFAVGEYNQVIMTDDFIIPFWADGRANDGNLNVNGAFIPVSDATAAERACTVSDQLSLEQNHPNPATGTASFSYTIAGRSAVRLVVTDLLGKEVARLVDAEMDAGRHAATVETFRLAPGAYHATLTTEAGFRSVRFVVAR
jgi:hypothetical protein